MKADYFLTQPVEWCVAAVTAIAKSYLAFNKEYGALFGLDKEVNGDVQEDKFNKIHGWKYSASAVAEYERIPLQVAFAMPVRQAFNNLVYLKAKAKYEAEQIKANGRQ